MMRNITEEDCWNISVIFLTKLTRITDNQSFHIYHCWALPIFDKYVSSYKLKLNKYLSKMYSLLRIKILNSERYKRRIDYTMIVF